MDTKIMQSMIDWVEEHLIEGFSIQDLGIFMGYSPYYCSFKFHQNTGITLKRYRLLRSMYLASQELKEYPSLPIIDIALKYGYSSQEAFTRTFKKLYGITPYDYRKSKSLTQHYQTINILKEIGDYMIDGSKKIEISQKQEKLRNQYTDSILNILNGEAMYQDFKSNQLMLDSGYVPFNEAMCINDSTYPIFSEEFLAIRAKGHQVSQTSYIEKVWQPFEKLKINDYQCLILWFGDDMFCQMNLLTLLAYLEQIDFKGDIYYHAVHEKTYDIDEYKMTLGSFTSLYQDVILNKQYNQNSPLPVLHQGIQLYLNWHQPINPIRQFIQMNLTLTEEDLLEKLMQLFPDYGLGDSQYEQLIKEYK